MASLRKKIKRLQYLLIIWLGPWVMRLLGWSVRLVRLNSEGADDVIRTGKSFIFSIWHGRIFMPVWHHRREKLVAMISQHADGETLTRVVQKIGYRAVRGSSTRGGKKAFLQLLVHLKGGGRGAIVPDGPTGPRFVMKPGTLLLAQKSHSYILPVTFAARPCWRLKSWDRMVLPKPFARAVLVYGDPILLPETTTAEEMEAWRKRVEKTMNDLVIEAEAYFGDDDFDPSTMIPTPEETSH